MVEEFFVAGADCGEVGKCDEWVGVCGGGGVGELVELVVRAGGVVPFCNVRFGALAWSVLIPIYVIIGSVGEYNTRIYCLNEYHV